MSGQWFPIMLLGILLAGAVGHDIVARRIPNWLVLAGLIAGLGFALYDGGGSDLVHSMFGSVIGLAIMLPFYALRAMGAGDVKLMTAVGAFLGPWQVTGAALLTFVSGGVLSLLAALCLRSLPRVAENLRLMGLAAIAGRASGLSVRDVGTTGRLPYAIAIAVGTVLQLTLAARGGWIFS